MVVDDEPLVLEDSLETIKEACPGAEIVSADNYRDALKEGKRICDVAFLDIELPGMNGLLLAEELKKYNPEINIIFLTAYSQYAVASYKIHASDYLLKPVSKDAVENAMANLRYKVKNRLCATCFGIFTAEINGEPLEFHREKEQELLAFLIAMKGDSVSGSQICAALWPETGDSKKDYFWKILSELRKDLSEAGVEDVLLCAKDSYSVDVTGIDCDFYRYLGGFNKNWNGRFMEQYSIWAEEIKGSIYFVNESK